MDAFESEALWRALKENEALFRHLRTFFVERREMRRDMQDAALGEAAVVLRGQCRELTAILNELFKETKR